MRLVWEGDDGTQVVFGEGAPASAPVDDLWRRMREAIKQSTVDTVDLRDAVLLLTPDDFEAYAAMCRVAAGPIRPGAADPRFFAGYTFSGYPVVTIDWPVIPYRTRLVPSRALEGMSGVRRLSRWDQERRR